MTQEGINLMEQWRANTNGKKVLVGTRMVGMVRGDGC